MQTKETNREGVQEELDAREKVLQKVLTASTELLETEIGVIDYKKFTDVIIDISGAQYASFNLFDENGRDFTTVAISGISKNLLKATSTLGFDLQNKKWDYDPVRDKKIQGRKVTIFESLHELTGEVISPKISAIIEKSFNIGIVAVVRITKAKKAVGDFTILFERGKKFENQEIVELFANLTGLLIFRAQAEEKLENQMLEVKKINSLMVNRELQMVALKAEIKKLRG